jgi:hypothetical protein
VYAINKELIVYVFGVCAKGYVKDSKGQVNKSLALQASQNCRIAPTNCTTNWWNAKSLGLPYSIKYPTIISVIYQRKKVTYFTNKNAITFMRIEKGQKVDWAQIIYNNLCNELDRWYKYVKENRGDKKDICQSTLILAKIFQYLFVHQRRMHKNH